MALTQRRGVTYAESQADIRAEIVRYSKLNGYPADHLAEAVCTCGAAVFTLQLDDAAGVAVRRCASCRQEHPMGDSADFLAEADLQECACPCGGERFEITAGVSLYAASEDIRWLYIGCRCPACGITGVYGDWKNECEGFRDFLARV